MPHLPQVLLQDRSAGWWMKMTSWPSEIPSSPTIPHTQDIHHCLCLSNTLFELVLRWTRPVRRASSSRSAISWLTSFSRGGRSLAARSRRGRWGECSEGARNLIAYSIYFLEFFIYACLHSSFSSSSTNSTMYWKGQLTQKWKCSHDLLTPMPMERQVTRCNPCRWKP